MRDAIDVFIEAWSPGVYAPAQTSEIAGRVLRRYDARREHYTKHGTCRAEALIEITQDETLDRMFHQDTPGHDADARLVRLLFGDRAGKDDVRVVLSVLVADGNTEEFKVAVAYLDIAETTSNSSGEGPRVEAWMVAENLRIPVGRAQHLLSCFLDRLGGPSDSIRQPV